MPKQKAKFPVSILHGLARRGRDSRQHKCEPIRRAVLLPELSTSRPSPKIRACRERDARPCGTGRVNKECGLQRFRACESSRQVATAATTAKVSSPHFVDTQDTGSSFLDPLGDIPLIARRGNPPGGGLRQGPSAVVVKWRGNDSGRKGTASFPEAYRGLIRAVQCPGTPTSRVVPRAMANPFGRQEDYLPPWESGP